MVDFTGRSYREASERLGSRDTLNIGWHTTLERRGEDRIAVKYHATDVVIYVSDGSVILDSGGWKTQTTKTRMNDYSPLGVRSEKGVWRVSKGYNQPSVLYRDGMSIGPRGGIRNAGSPARERKEQKQRKRINAFARSFAAAVVAGEVPLPSGGDCWFCLMFDKEPRKMETSADHLWGHVEESYFVPSLLVNACEALGASDALRSSIYGWATGDDKYVWFQRDNWGEQQVANIVRRYMLRRLGFSDGGPGLSYRGTR
jgi:hypothetical protein